MVEEVDSSAHSSDHCIDDSRIGWTILQMVASKLLLMTVLMAGWKTLHMVEC